MSLRAIACFVTLLLPACGPSRDRCDAGPWQTVLLDHHLRYPSLEMTDALKMLQQAALGSEHAVTDANVARLRLREELMAMDAGPIDQLVDTLGPGGRFARVNLRPWRAAGGNPDVLVDAFVATASEPTDTAALSCALDVLQRLADEYRLPWGSEEVRQAVGGWNAAGRPTMHHSPAFEERYQPAYRVVAVSRIAGLLMSLPGGGASP
jgi:hypothetical protein